MSGAPLEGYDKVKKTVLIRLSLGSVSAGSDGYSRYDRFVPYKRLRLFFQRLIGGSQHLRSLLQLLFTGIPPQRNTQCRLGLVFR